MNTIDLNGTWQLTHGPQQAGYGESTPPPEWPTVPAQVPGNVELDLVSAGILPELSVGNNIYLLRQYEGHEWWYSRSFSRPDILPFQAVHLVFDGLDCIADVWLNNIC